MKGNGVRIEYSAIIKILEFTINLQQISVLITYVVSRLLSVVECQ